MCKLTSCAPAAGKPAVSQLQNGGKSLKWEGDVRGGCDGVGVCLLTFVSLQTASWCAGEQLYTP